MSEGRVWTVRIVAPCQFITANMSTNRGLRGRLIREWRHATVNYARAANLPTDLDRVRVDAEFRFRGRAPVRDRDNLRPTLKAIIDGLGPGRHTTTAGGARSHAKGHGLIPDDSDRHLDGPHLSIGDPLPAAPYGAAGEVWLTITEVTDAPGSS